VDGSLLTELTSAPYEVSLDPATYATGSHVLRVEAVDTAGSVGSTELAFAAESPAGGGPSLGLLAAGVLLLLLAVAGAVGLVAIARRRPRTPEVTTRVRPWSSRRNGEPEPQEWTGGDMQAPSDEPLGRLVVAGGPQQGAAVEVGSRPLRIGSAPHCDLVLTDVDGGVAPEEARVWVSEGRLLYHKLTRLTTFASDGPTGGWFVLADRDEIRLGPHSLVFELLSQKDVYAEAVAVLDRGQTEQAVTLPPSPETGETEPPAALDVDVPWRAGHEPAGENAEDPDKQPRRGSGSRRRREKKESTASQAAAWLRGEEQQTVDLQVANDADLDDEND
jgi:hypothetical protein